MRRFNLLIVVVYVCVNVNVNVNEVFAADSEPPTAPKVRYRQGKAINFDELTVRGGLQRPEISVVTGDGKENDSGLLRLREAFLDRMAADAAEEIQ